MGAFIRSNNKDLLLGNQTRDPELRYAPQEAAVSELSLALNRVYTSKKTGQKTEEVTFLGGNRSASPVITEPGDTTADTTADTSAATAPDVMPILRDQVTSTPRVPAGAAVATDWLAAALATAMTRTSGCFLCKWTVESLCDGALRPTGRSDGSGGDQFPVNSQLAHLRLEHGS